MTDTEIFLNAIAGKLPEDERLVLCGFRGDPNEAPTNAWKPRPWQPGVELPFGSAFNAYSNIASFGRAPDSGFRRRKDTFKAGRAFMIDDVGNSPSSKVDPSKVDIIKPTFITETSPGNFQWLFVLKEPERDADKFDAFIRAFIAGRLLGADPGMSGITRVCRVPGFTNGKPQHAGFITKLTLNNSKARFTLPELLKKFDLKLQGLGVRPTKFIPNDISKKRIKMFVNVETFLQRRKMFKRSSSDPSGWREMTCPWKDEHTHGADTGAAIREPRPENQFYGAFRCHHGSHIDKHWQDLTDWIADLAADEVNDNTRFVRITK